MELQTAIEIIEYHQQWRLGNYDDMIHTPRALTEALDIVLREAKRSPAMKDKIELGEYLRDDLGDNLRYDIWDDLGGNVWSNLARNLWNNLWDNLGDNLATNIRESIKQSEL